jgi:hypothetical protein
MKLREPKQDAQHSNWINPLLTVAKGAVQRAGYQFRRGKAKLVTFGDRYHTTENIGSEHVFYASLNAMYQLEVITISWYHSITHQNVTYGAGRLVEWQHSDGKC